MCTCSWLCKGLCTGVQYPQRPEEGIRPPRARISGCLTWVLRTELGSSTRTIHTFNSRATSPALSRPFLWVFFFLALVFTNSTGQFYQGSIYQYVSLFPNLPTSQILGSRWENMWRYMNSVVDKDWNVWL